MATCLEYAAIAYAAYYKRVANYASSPPGHMVEGWDMQDWTDGAFAGSGFQGGIWYNDVEMIIGISGTNKDQRGKFIRDLGADIKIALGMLPRGQANALESMVDKATQVSAGRPITLTGHSLGGGLAQVIGLKKGLKFVTFNAPAMVSAWTRSGNVQRLGNAVGKNFRLDGDVVSSTVLGKHIGEVIVLPGALSKGAHNKKNCWQTIMESAWFDVQPFG